MIVLTLGALIHHKHQINYPIEMRPLLSQLYGCLTGTIIIFKHIKHSPAHCDKYVESTVFSVLWYPLQKAPSFVGIIYFVAEIEASTSTCRKCNMNELFSYNIPYLTGLISGLSLSGLQNTGLNSHV